LHRENFTSKLAALSASAKSMLHDPNNHCPEASLHDEWADAPGQEPGDFPQSAFLLPKRKRASDKMTEASAVSAGILELGLRIDSKRSLPTDRTERGGIEVQELNPTVIRLEQAEPMPPKVESLITFHPRPDFTTSGSKPQEERNEWGRSKKRHPAFWMLGAGAGVTATVLLTLALLPLINASNAIKSDPRKRTFAVENEAEPANAQRINQLLERKTEALRLFKSFAKASHSDEVKPLILNGMTLESALRTHWQPLTAATQWNPSAVVAWEAFEENDRLYLTLSGSFSDQSKFHVYFTPVDERLAIDWKATTAFGTACFEDLESQSGDASEIRGRISTSDFYSATWPEAEYSSYRLASPNGNHSIWCYANRNTPAAATLANLFHQGEILQDSTLEKKITLSLKGGRDGARPNQWLIDEVLGIDWGTP
jgi:hypothetical protein